MNPEVKQKWIAALRSGKYPQTIGALRDTQGFCCLGVLCDVNGAEWEQETGEKRFVTDRGEVTGLSFDHRIEIGLACIPHHNLMAMNDEGKDFRFIADYIEQTL